MSSVVFCELLAEQVAICGCSWSAEITHATFWRTFYRLFLIRYYSGKSGSGFHSFIYCYSISNSGAITHHMASWNCILSSKEAELVLFRFWRTHVTCVSTISYIEFYKQYYYTFTNFSRTIGHDPYCNTLVFFVWKQILYIPAVQIHTCQNVTLDCYKIL